MRVKLNHPKGKTLINSFIQFLTSATQSIKIAASTSAATMTTGAATWLDWIPTDIGKLASLIGLALSIVLINGAIKKRKMDRDMHESEMKKNELEMELLEANLRKANEENN